MGFFFISYKHTDHVFVDELKRRLDAEDIDTWTDEKIKAGEEWKKAIDRWIDRSVGVLVVVTPESLMSPYVTYEWSYALGLGDKNKPVIPLFLRQPDHETKVEFTPNPTNVSGIKIEIHPRLGDLQGYYFTDEAPPEWDKLIRKLKEILSEGDLSDALKEKERELNDSNQSIWQAAIDSLEKWGEPGATNVLAKAATKHNNEEVQKLCTLALCRRTKNTDARAIPGLKLLVESRSPILDGTTLQALGDLAVANHEDALVILESVLTKHLGLYVSWREQAANQLGRIKDERALRALLNALNEEKTDAVLNAIIVGLGAQGSAEALEPLKVLLSKTQENSSAAILRREKLFLALVRLGEDGISNVIKYVYAVNIYKSDVDSIVRALQQVPNQAVPMLKAEYQGATDHSKQQVFHAILNNL